MKQAGFSLLEAIVALVIVATAGVSLFTWVNTNLLSLNRVQAIQQRDAAIQNALAFVSTINPTEQPDGEETLGIYTINWQASLVEPARRGTDNLGAPSFYEVGLYELAITVLVDNQEIAQFKVRQVGYKQVQQPDYR